MKNYHHLKRRDKTIMGKGLKEQFASKIEWHLVHRSFTLFWWMVFLTTYLSCWQLLKDIYP